MGDSIKAYWDDYKSCSYCSGDITYARHHFCFRQPDKSFMVLTDEERLMLSNAPSKDWAEQGIIDCDQSVSRLKEEIIRLERRQLVLEYFIHSGNRE